MYRKRENKAQNRTHLNCNKDKFKNYEKQSLLRAEDVKSALSHRSSLVLCYNSVSDVEKDVLLVTDVSHSLLNNRILAFEKFLPLDVCYYISSGFHEFWKRKYYFTNEARICMLKILLNWLTISILLRFTSWGDFGSDICRDLVQTTTYS